MKFDNVRLQYTSFERNTLLITQVSVISLTKRPMYREVSRFNMKKARFKERTDPAQNDCN